VVIDNDASALAETILGAIRLATKRS